MPTGVYQRNVEQIKQLLEIGKSTRFQKGHLVPLGWRERVRETHKGKKILPQQGFQKGNKINLGRKRPDVAGENNHLWKGDDASYSALHQRLQKIKGSPKKCEICGLDDKKRVYHWANLTGKFEDPDDYERMCVPCHRKYDYGG